MGDVDGVNYAELFGPEAGDPSQNQHGDIRLVASLGKCGSKHCTVAVRRAAPSTSRVVITSDGRVRIVVGTDIGAVCGSDMVCVTVVAMVDVGAEGGSDMAVGSSVIEDDVAGSMFIRGGSGSGTLNTDFSRFFKASMGFWILVSRCNGLM
uniref:Uncharacterized protein n=1 Tax=Romanomermis culicivorax TaxID=13658 RepID=A0A915KHC1_ROMCU